jgi:hypothetical protein
MRPTLRVRSSRRQVSGFVLAHLGVASVQCNNLLLDVTLLIERRVLACLWRVDMVRLHALLAWGASAAGADGSGFLLRTDPGATVEARYRCY